jgi:histidinol phosphatase-like PHP family hydrolase
VYDLHTHTFFSDGVLIPAELARRCQVRGYEGLVISDHCDHSNLERVIEHTRRFCEASAGHYGEMRLRTGCEITHVQPELIAGLVASAREAGAEVVLVHGETIVEPVAPGTNRAAIEAGVDVLAHPGLISEQDVQRAGENGVLLEITARKGHSLTNGHVARIATRAGAALSFGSDGHVPGDYPDEQRAQQVLRGAGLNTEHIDAIWDNCAAIFED